MKTQYINPEATLDSCHDCGSPMKPAELRYNGVVVAERGEIDGDGEVYVQCAGCGSRAGHRKVEVAA